MIIFGIPMFKNFLSVLAICSLLTSFNQAYAETVYVEKDFPDASGKKITYCGTIAQTIKKKLPYSGAVIFLNFERPYPHTLVSLMIPNNSIRNFPNVKAYLGKRICVKGVFYEYDRDDNRGKIYNMTISSPSDIN